MRQFLAVIFLFALTSCTRSRTLMPEPRPEGFGRAWWEYVDKTKNSYKDLERTGWILGYVNAAIQALPKEYQSSKYGDYSVIGLTVGIRNYYIAHPGEDLSVGEVIERFLDSPKVTLNADSSKEEAPYWALEPFRSSGQEWQANPVNTCVAFVEGAIEYHKRKTKYRFSQPAGVYVTLISNYFNMRADGYIPDDKLIRERVAHILLKFHDGVINPKQAAVSPNYKP